MIKKIMTFLIVAALIIGCIPFNAAASNEKTAVKVTAKQSVIAGNKIITDNLLKYLNAYEANKNFHGNILIAKEGKILVSKGFGKADYEKNIKNTTKTRFAIGSITKQFTAMAIMQLQDKGLLNVNDKLSKYVPDFKNGNRITLHQLLTRVSGIVDYLTLQNAFKEGMTEISDKDVLDVLKTKELVNQPGSKWEYSNSNYMLLGYIVEKVSKQSYGEYLSKNIFTPLGMKDTGVCYQGNKKMYTGKGYQGYLDLSPVDGMPLLKLAFGAGCLYSTVEDLYKWDRGLRSGKLLSRKSLNTIFTAYNDAAGNGSYGYGWGIIKDEYGRNATHGGNTIGYTSKITRYLDKDLTVIMLTNSSYYNAVALERTLKGIIANKKYVLPVKKTELKIESGIIDEYSGVYKDSSGNQIIVSNEDDILHALLPNLGKLEFVAASKLSFFCRSFDYEISFIKDKDNMLISMAFNSGGNKSTLIKQSGEVVGNGSTVTVEPAILDKYVGEYLLLPNVSIVITYENHKLYAKATGQEKYQILPESETKFIYVGFNIKIAFIVNEKGETTELILTQNGMDFKAKKK